VTQKEWSSPVMVGVQDAARAGWQIRRHKSLHRVGAGSKGPVNSIGPTAEKTFYALIFMRPYRKPTLVGEESIHRCSGELSLRNSAI
jgi:hypothetical protein